MRLIKYLRKYWYFALLAPLMMIGEVSMDLLQPKLMSTIVDNGILGNDLALIVSTGIKMLVFTVIGGLFGILSAAFASTASQSFANDLRTDAFAHVMHMSIQQTDKITTGSLVTRLTNDITMVQNFISMALRMFVRSGFMFVGGIFMALSLNSTFGMILAVSLPVQLIITGFFVGKTAPFFSVIQTKLDKVNSVMQENVSGARVVKAYVKEKHETKRFTNANDDLMQTNLKVLRLFSLLGPILMVIMNLSVIAVIYIGGLQVEARNMEVGSVMACVTYTTQILMSIMMVSMMLQNVSRASASAKRILEVLDESPVVIEGLQSPEKGKGSVALTDVSFAYPHGSGKQILHDINLTVNPGETVAILGATGSGKTTLVNLIGRYYDIQQGTITVDGTDIRDMSFEALRSKVGYVLQKSELFSGTVKDNIKWGNKNASDEDVVTAAKIAQADEFIATLPAGYDTVIGQKGMSLSGGQKQRLSIARAILKSPEILIFDDSTSALDLSTEARLHKALREKLDSTTLIIIAQRIASVMGADKIAVIDGGTIVAVGTHKELMQSCSAYIDIYNSQLGKEENVNE